MYEYTRLVLIFNFGNGYFIHLYILYINSYIVDITDRVRAPDRACKYNTQRPALSTAITLIKYC